MKFQFRFNDWIEYGFYDFNPNQATVPNSFSHVIQCDNHSKYCQNICVYHSVAIDTCDLLHKVLVVIEWALHYSTNWTLFLCVMWNVWNRNFKQPCFSCWEHVTVLLHSAKIRATLKWNWNFCTVVSNRNLRLGLCTENYNRSWNYQHLEVRSNF